MEMVLDIGNIMVPMEMYIGPIPMRILIIVAVLILLMDTELLVENQPRIVTIDKF